MTQEIQLNRQVADEHFGLRLDQAAAQAFPEYSRARLQEWIKDGHLTVNGQPGRAKDKVTGGEKLALQARVESQEHHEPEVLDLDVVYEDKALIIINKPVGLVVHPGSGNHSGTMLNGLLSHCKALAKLPRAGIVHRLDKDTSGLLVVAKTLPAHQSLVAQLQERSVSRHYDAVVQGVMTAGGTVDAAIGRHPVLRQKRAVTESGGGDARDAVTHYRVKARYRSHTHLQLQLETGRTHQIRVHMAHIGFPIVGDQVYGGRLKPPKGASPALLDFLQQFRRQALHARQLGLFHPTTGDLMEWKLRCLQIFSNCWRCWIRIVTDTAGLWRPDWKLPAGVHAFVSTRLGSSTGPWQSFNLGQHVGDAAATVAANRSELQQQIGALAGMSAVPSVQWIHQVHGTTVLRAAFPGHAPAPEADAIHTRSPGLAIAVLTADCLPVLFCDSTGREIGVAHAGWRGLLNGVLEAAVDGFSAAPEHLRAWLGPAIGPCHFEVGDEVRAAFLKRAAADDAAATAAAFVAARQPGKWFADLYALARTRLRRAGLRDIAGEPLCTSCNTGRFYSYRQQAVTGRFATLIMRTG